MSAWIRDVSTTVEYSSDKWCMDRVPWAMWVCAAGLAVALNTGGSGGKGAALALVYFALLVLTICGYFLTEKIDRSSISLYATIPIILIVAIAIEFVIDLTMGSRGRSGTNIYGTNFWTGMINPPLHVGGWLIAYMGGGWIAGSLYQHTYPSKPTFVLSPAGIALHRIWLKDVHIPWYEITATSNARGTGLLGNPHLAGVEVTRDFYERQIAPKLSVLAPPGEHGMFHPSGDKMIVVLTTSEQTDGLENTRAAISERWNAFRDQASSTAAEVCTIPEPHEKERAIQGRWTFEGSLWQTGMFAAPLIATAAVVVFAAIHGQ